MRTIAVVTNLPTPYRKKQFDLIADKLDGRLNIYFTDRFASDRKWQIAAAENYHFLPTLLRCGRFGRLNGGLLNIVRKHDCVVIGGYEQPTYILLALLCQLTKTPYAVIFDGIAPSRITGKDRWPTRLIKRWILGNAAACLANGTVSRKYIGDVLDLPVLALYSQLLSVDDLHFNVARPQRSALRSAFFRAHQLPASTRLIFYSGRLIARKHVDHLIEAISAIPSATLVIAGHGPEEYRLRALCADHHVDAIFLGHLEPEQLAQTYVLSDCLVLPSTDEPWGLVVNEALFAGTAVVVSDDCGCAQDLVVTQQNGFIFCAGDVPALGRSIESAIALDTAQVQATTALLIQQWNLDNSANNFVTMVQDCIASGNNADSKRAVA